MRRTLSAALAVFEQVRCRIWPKRGRMTDPWCHRVFGTTKQQPDPTLLLQHLQHAGFDVNGQFRRDDLGWFSADVAYDAGAEPLRIEHYLSGESGLRSELKRWTAWIETLSTNVHQDRLLDQLGRTAQVFTLTQPVNLSILGRIMEMGRVACRFLARETAGLYLMDGQGIFAADGTSLVHPEEE